MKSIISIFNNPLFKIIYLSLLIFSSMYDIRISILLTIVYILFIIYSKNNYTEHFGKIIKY